MVNYGPENFHRGAAAACNCQTVPTDIVIPPSAPVYFHNWSKRMLSPYHLLVKFEEEDGAKKTFTLLNAQHDRLEEVFGGAAKK
jgi:hypothetical protein